MKKYGVGYIARFYVVVKSSSKSEKVIEQSAKALLDFEKDLVKGSLQSLGVEEIIAGAVVYK